jgi:nucleotidyltransferase substrate binding protein (TIGR01987 family)
MVTAEEMITQLEKATARLDEAVRLEKNAINRDSAILRFVLVAELAWKTIKWHLEDKLQVRCASPKTCFREAYNQGIIEYENQWIKMATDRNFVAHLYKEEWADAIYERLPDYLRLVQNLIAKLKKD